MKIDDTFFLGIVSKKFGYKGDIICVFDVDKPEKYTELESVFLLINKKLVPFFIEKISFRPNSNQAIIRFKGIDNEKKAEDLIDCEMYLPLDMLPPLSGNQFYFHEVEGFKVYDTRQGYIGEIEKILDYPGNPLFQIKRNLNEILIPVSDKFIKEVDRKLKKIVVTTPEGLLGIYTNDVS